MQTIQTPNDPFIDRILGELNEPQRDAVSYTEGPLLVLAGAGSGKTRVITYRIAYLIAAMNCSPWNILSVTFTNKAAGEMRERVAQLLNTSLRGFWIGTFHSICARMLRMDGHATGIDPKFTIYDRSDSLAAVKRAIQGVEIDIKNPNSVLNWISQAKNRFEFPDQVVNRAEGEFDINAAKIYKKYQEILRENNALDFDDLLVESVRLLLHSPETCKSYQNRFRYILVDEYQDTNHPQYLLLRELAKAHNRICVVGDDDQSIYRWRGADIRNILEFGQDFTNAKVVRLEQNYRSTKNIIEAAYHVVKNNSTRHPKKLWTEQADGEKIAVVSAPDETGEAMWISDEIAKLKDEKKLPYGGFAVFYRTNAQSRLFEEEFVRRGIPYTIVGATAFYQRKEIKDVIAYLRLMANPADAVSFQRIVNEPKRKLGASSVEKLIGYATLNRLSVLKAAYNIASEQHESGLSTQARKGFSEFARMYIKWMNEAEKLSLGELVNRVLDESGYRAMLAESKDPQEQARLENIEELLNACYQFEEDFIPDGDEELKGLDLLAKFLENSALVSDQDSLNEERDGVVLMTVHSAKGLEYPCVFLTGMEEGLFPHQNSMDSKAGLEEERRLCYVGITRGKSKVYITNAYSRRLYNRSEYTIPSRFIDEIPGELKESVGFSPKGRMNALMDFSEFQGSLPIPKQDSELEIGDMVNHRSFGIGVIIEIQGEGGSAHITVDFQGFGKKTLVREYAKLQKV